MTLFHSSNPTKISSRPTGDGVTTEGESYMHYLAAVLHTLGVTASEHANKHINGDRERGSVTLEQILWGVALAALAAAVVAVIRTFVMNRAGQLGT